VSDSPRAALIPGEVHVRYRQTDMLGEDDRQIALALLSDGERVRHARFHFDRDRDEFAAAHALLRTTLSEFGATDARDWRFREGAHGKPALAPGSAALPLSFNLSHTRGLVACAVALDADVGIDVESIARATDWRAIAARFFSAVEVAHIDRVAEQSRATRFLELWTLKEAFAKALGVGLLPQLEAAAFELDRPGVITCALPAAVDPAAWQFALYTPVPGHRLALAVSDGSARRWRIHVRAAADEPPAVRLVAASAS
jgi:4'-phosphopantetheinyl transferase